MEIPRYPAPQRSSLDLPEIFVQGSSPSDPHRSSSRDISYNSRFSSPTSSKPMSIPNSGPPIVPPALPPPRFFDSDIDVGNGTSDPGWMWEESRREGSSWGRSPVSVPPGSSLYNSFETSSGRSILEDRPEFERRRSSSSTIKSNSGVGVRLDAFIKEDEGYASLSGTSIGSNLSVLIFYK